MPERPFRLEIGPYWITLPGDAKVSANVTGPCPGAYQTAPTHWLVLLERFRISISLGSHELAHLKRFIDDTTQRDVVTPPISVNGVPGVRHGGYGPPRTWIDYWFRKGDATLCLCLQSIEFPVTQPTGEEIAEHDEIIGSIKYSSDFRYELPPS